MGNTVKGMRRIVIDTNVLVAALRSNRGWSYSLLSAVGDGGFEHAVTVPLVMEYEAVLLRPGMVSLPAAAVQDVIDYLCATAIQQAIHFLWRPRLLDPKDDMVLEAAVNAGCDAIVTHNLRHFGAAAGLGVQVLSPAQFMNRPKERAR
jgi:putative PIN family toxin of toxin-antitoxin system